MTVTWQAFLRLTRRSVYNFLIDDVRRLIYDRRGWSARLFPIDCNPNALSFNFNYS
ncbi:unnamed protein product [Rhodiola kirilowii]